MCKSKSKTDATTGASSSISGLRRRRPSSSATGTSSSATATSSRSTLQPPLSSSSSAFSNTSSSTTSSLPRSSLPALDNPHVYTWAEISSATNNFLSPRLSPSSSAWRCTLRGRESVVVQRRLVRPLDPLRLQGLLSSISKLHHSSLVPLLGASLSAHHACLVYPFAPGAPLSRCLRHPSNPSYTPLPSFLSRLRIAADLASALRYLHHDSAALPQPHPLAHNHVTSSSVIVSDSLHASLCHLGAAQITGEEAASSDATSSIPRLQGTVGYMPPEFARSGASLKADVYAFGVVVLELLTGREPLISLYHKDSNRFETISLVDSAREVVVDSGNGAVSLRWWMDARMRDSFPVEVSEKVVRLALECVEGEAEKRPDMVRVAGKLSKMYLESERWFQKMKTPMDFSVSMAPR